MTENIFESAKQIDGNGNEYWSARELQQILEYSEWRNFQRTIDRAITSCETAGYDKEDHFVELNKMVAIGSGAQRPQMDFSLSRYACYLIVQNGDPSKAIIAAGQAYFAILTRRQELADEEMFNGLDEDQQRLLLRRQVAEHNTALYDAAHAAGIEQPVHYAVFQNYGYRGLYGGLDQSAIHRRKKLKKSQKILDHMGSTELAANLFRATQTADKLNREKIKGRQAANQVHFDVGQTVRRTIQQLGGTMPEDLPTPQKSIKQLEREQKKKIEDKNK